MENKLYVGNLSYSTNDESLNQAFSQAGKVVSATVMKDKMTGRSRGFGFVEMSNDEEAQNAINMFNDKDLDGRQIRVNVAKPMEDRPRFSNNGPRSGGNNRRDDRGGRSQRW